MRDFVLTKSECSSVSVLSRDNLKEKRREWAAGTGVEGAATPGPSDETLEIEGRAAAITFTTLYISSPLLCFLRGNSFLKTHSGSKRAGCNFVLAGEITTCEAFHKLSLNSFMPSALASSRTHILILSSGHKNANTKALTLKARWQHMLITRTLPGMQRHRTDCMLPAASNQSQSSGAWREWAHS